MNWRQFEQIALDQVPRDLSKILGLESNSAIAGPTDGYDFAIQTSAGRFVVEVKARAEPAALAGAWAQVEQAALGAGPANVVPLIVVPFMPEGVRGWCAYKKINWLDLSGNADIHGPGIRILLQGSRNRFATRGRPSNVFAPASTRLSRRLLMEPGRVWSTRELMKATGFSLTKRSDKELAPQNEGEALAPLNEGYVSRMVRRMLEDGLLERHGDHNFRVKDPALLLDAWWAAADFSANQVIRGHIATRSGDDLLRSLTHGLYGAGLAHATTGLGAAWLYDHFAAFRNVTMYLWTWPTADQLANIGFREGDRGANTWLVVPRDLGVFDDRDYGMVGETQVPRVSLIQTYIDLKGQPERSSEAAENLRGRVLEAIRVHSEV